MKIRTAVLGAVALVMLAGGCGNTEPAGRRGSGTSRSSTSTSLAASRALLPAGDNGVVTRVVDGDTLVVRGDERDDERVRLIGIDTPETKDPRKPVQCFGRRASARTGELLEPGTAVRLVYDVERNDRYGRTLAYVYRRTDGMFVNAVLVRDGYASAYTYPPNVAHADEFVALQREARDADRGLWGACGGSSAPRGSSAPTSATRAAGSAGAACDPAYPDGCIPPPPPDLDCGDITARRFRVLAPDPHRFDSNGDGIGCEGQPG